LICRELEQPQSATNIVIMSIFGVTKSWVYGTSWSLGLVVLFIRGDMSMFLHVL
jgi:hypothetical protein